MATWATTGELAQTHADLMSALYDLDDASVNAIGPNATEGYDSRRLRVSVLRVITAYRAYSRKTGCHDPPRGRGAMSESRLTPDQRSIADEIASAMDYGHEDGCAVWWEDPDGCSCPLLDAVGRGLLGAGVVELTMERGFDRVTRRGHALVRQTFNPHPLQAPAVTQGKETKP